MLFLHVALTESLEILLYCSYELQETVYPVHDVWVCVRSYEFQETVYHVHDVCVYVCVHPEGINNIHVN